MSNRNAHHSAAQLGLSLALLAGQFGLSRAQFEAKQEDRLDDARDAYYESLRALEQDADNQRLKEEAFIRGIIYAGLMRDDGQESSFDETTVTEDILRALRLGAKGRPDRPDAVERLRELEAVREAGLITDEEYKTKREEILDEI